VTLAVHPRFGERIAVIGAHGKDGICAETRDGERLLPIAWTSLRPRAEPLVRGGRRVRLSPEGLRDLARWTASRMQAARGKQVGHFNKHVENRGPDGNASGGAKDRERDETTDDGIGKHSGAGDRSPVAVVGEARATDTDRRTRRGTR
jgi:hypothetical protein